MFFSLPWAFPQFGGQWEYEQYGFFGLLISIVVCFAVGIVLRYFGRRTHGDQLFRREAMAVVGLSWILATVLGALPFLFSGTHRAPGIPMNAVDAMFEAQSGFSTTGATVLTELQDPALVPRSILFWRSSTHFLGGLGIIVLFVAILGQGSAGKALMRAEMPGPSHSSQQARMQHTAWVLVLVYTGLNAALTLLLCLEGMSLFDGLCHAFGTMATGGFSTYNASVGYFMTNPQYNGPLIEMTITMFMFLAGTNFMLLYAIFIWKPMRMFGDVEWRTYVTIILLATVAIIGVGLYNHDFEANGMVDTALVHSGEIADDSEINDTDKIEAKPPESTQSFAQATRFSLFQVVSIMTTTGYCTDNFDVWCSFSRGVLLLLMFVGGCAGSTGGGLKVIRYILFTKVLRLEVEHAFHPNVVRPLRLGGKPVEDQTLRKNILVYFGLIMAIFAMSWLFTITFEPDTTWSDYGHKHEHKLIDAASCVSATLNNIGPGLGVVGATQNYSNFTMPTKVLFIWLMMIGRLEIFVILILFIPKFWITK
jgi:trk system potassium uptake protein TrkH